MTKHIQSILSMLFFIALAVPIFGQGTITGVVRDAEGESLIGTNILIKGTSTGTVTDIDGNYTLEVPVGEQILLFSYTGFISQEQAVSLLGGERRTINIVMDENAEALDEVVVIGYGTKRKSELTGSISKITSDEITQISTHSFETALQGQAAGVQVVQGSGLAGSASVVRIRGTSSIGAGGDPLYVVDGIPITQDYFLGENRGNQNNNPLSTINPNDIESVEVLKDASAAAIYGSRGANGVIIITTKRGKKGRPAFNFNARVGTADPTRRVDFVNTQELLQLWQEGWENDGNTGRVPLPAVYTQEGYTYEDAINTNTNWFDEVLQTGTKQEYNFSVRQGSDVLSLYAGLSFLDNETYMVGNRFQRMSGRLNLDLNVSPKFKIGWSQSYARSLTDRVDPLGGSLGLAQSNALPFYPIFNEDGSYFNPSVNPVARNDLFKHRTIELRNIQNFTFNYRPSERWSFNAQISFDQMNLSDNIFQDFDFLFPDPNNGSGVFFERNSNQSERWNTTVNNWSAFGTVEYDFKESLGTNHSLTALVGIEYQNRSSNGEYGRYGLLDDFVYKSNIEDRDTNSLLTDEETFFTVEDDRFFSTFTRLSYDFQDKYFLQFTLRVDGSSRFGDNNRFGYFPSVGLGWIISRERGWNSRTVNFLKLKASWGHTGNSGIPWQEQFAGYSFNRPGEINSGRSYNGQALRHINKFENPDTQWERVSTVDVGVEVGFLNDRITTDITYYQRRTSNLYLALARQASLGLENLVTYKNTGKLLNEGIEFGLTSRNIVAANAKQFSWKTTINLGLNRNEILDVSTATPDALAGGFGDTRAIVGEAINTNFIIRFLGYDQNGYPLYENAETGEAISAYREAFDRQVVGNGMPWLVGGVTNEFSWHNFDLSAFFVLSLGGEIYDDAAKRQRSTLSNGDGGAWTVRRDIIGNYWQVPGDELTKDYGRLTLDPANYGLNSIWNNNTTRFIEDASYVRLRTLTLGYSFPNPPKGFGSIRIYFTGQNILTFTDYTGWDPEVARERLNTQERNVGGTSVTYLTPPQEKSYMFGINIDF